MSNPRAVATATPRRMTTRPEGPSGLLVVDKPAAWTSHDVVAKLRGVLGTRKVGHAGTLDPDATGVLLVGVGRVTRLLRFLAATTKAYECEIVLGIETSTLDAGGEVTATHDMSWMSADGVADESVRAAARALTGDIMQVPPMVSAVKVDGTRLHQLARAGVEVERQARPVHVSRFDVASTADPLVWRAEVECSSGTYVRTLAADLGSALQGGAHLRALRRIRVGSFGLDEAVGLEAASVERLLAPADALRDLEALTIEGEVAVAVGHGKVLEREVLGAAGEGPWRVLGPDGTLLAVYEAHKHSTVKPSVVVGGDRGAGTQ
jgi:tRNA pseudouridine55 synthase